MDQHHTELQHWAATHFTQVFQLPELDKQRLLAGWSQVAGDASVRCYYRLQYGERSVIVMDSSRDLDAAAEFARVAQILRDGGVRVPKIYSADFSAGYQLLEDFGNQMLKAQLAENRGDVLFAKVLPVLQELALCDCQELKAFSAQMLEDELMMFEEWYLQRHRNYFMPDEELRCWGQLKKLLVESALAQPQVTVHRDFHSCNLHQLDDDEIGVIDFQDSVAGPVTYDLASWVWDRYMHWPRESVVRWIEQARESLRPAFSQPVSASNWLRYCDYMGLQRNIKIVGIFARLYYRDGKKGYLEMIPQFAAYIREVLPLYDELQFAVGSMDNWLE